MTQQVDSVAQHHLDVSSPEDITEIPQRSRNARAQARHRAKRKAYIEKLEENVSKLQALLGLTSEQVSDLPPASMIANRNAELEMENRHLREQLRALQTGQTHQSLTRWSPETPNGIEYPPHMYPVSADQYGRDSKKRKISSGTDSLSSSHVLGSVATSPTLDVANELASRAQTQPSSSIGSLSHNSRQPTSADHHQATFSPNQSYMLPVKSEPSYVDLAVLSPALAPSNPVSPTTRSTFPGTSMRHQAMERHPLDQNNREHVQMLDRDHHYIVGNTARSIFGDDDESYGGTSLSQQQHPVLHSRGFPLQQHLMQGAGRTAAEHLNGNYNSIQGFGHPQSRQPPSPIVEMHPNGSSAFPMSDHYTGNHWANKRM